MWRGGERRGTPADLLAVGLGNPGAEYARTRHNAGAETVELLAARHGARLKRGKELALVAEVQVSPSGPLSGGQGPSGPLSGGQGPSGPLSGGHGPLRLALAFPQTYMNESGRSVALLVRRFGITDVGRLVVVHDELDLPIGKLQVKAGGGLAGHNGLRSIKAYLHSDAFARIRIGIGKPPGGKEQGVDHVLRPPSKRERTELDVSIELAADAVECVLAEGVVAAQNRFNG